MLQLLLKLAKGSCSLFDIITTPDSVSRTIFQDFSTSSSQDYGFGVWTRYQTQYEDIPNLSIDQMNMFVLSDNSDQTLQFIYYITINRSEQTMIHSLVRMLDSAFLIHELKLNVEMIGNNWVYFYFCYSQSIQIYNIFLYIMGDQVNVQMQQEGPADIQYYEQREYQLGGLIELPDSLKTSMGGNLKTFAGEISDLHQKIGSSYFYEDIETFLDNLENLNCQYYQCPSTIQQIKITDLQIFDSSSVDLQMKIAYYQSKFTLKGWVLLQKLEENQSLESVLFRASPRKNYYDDIYQGDKALYWKYYQSTQYNSQNGFIFTTYHNSIHEVAGSYQTQNSDSWIIKNEIYKDSITFWHYFIYQEGIENQPFNIQLQVYFGYTRNTLNLQMTQNHYDHSKYYFSFGGDKYNSNFKGQIRNITFSFCYEPYQLFPRECHYSCNTCFGPLSNHCIDCADFQTSKRIVKDGVCVCYGGYVDTGAQNCEDKEVAFKYVDIKEEIDQNLLNCLYGEFQALLNGKKFCLQCPGQLNNFKLECIECIMNPLTWYLNPVCINDYFQPIFVENSDYVFLQKERNQIDYDLFLINQNTQTQTPSVEKCIGCKQLNDKLIKNFIQKYHLNQLKQVECKTCYKSMNNECFQITQNCLECDDSQLGIKCNSNSTLYNNQCINCPEYCPNCFMNQTGQFCNECLDGYYYNSTLQTCQQCGLYCQTCIYSLISDQLFCLKCVDIEQYFIATDFQNCKKKNLNNCKIQGAELDINQLSLAPPQPDFYVSTLDVRKDNVSVKAYSVCLLCEDGYINFMIVFMDYRCVHYDDTSLLNLPTQLKDKVKYSTNSEFQLAYTLDYSILTKPPVYRIILGDTVTFETKNTSNPSQTINVTYSSMVIKSNQQQPNCDDQNCEQCVKNFIQSQENCLMCRTGFYASLLTGRCYECPSDCEECREEYKWYNDAWKWDLIPYYIFRGSLSQSGFHSFTQYASSSDYVNYQTVCTKCRDNWFFQKGKCYPDCGCKTCIFQDGKSVCLECSNDTQTYDNGQCINCPSTCSICKQLNQDQIFAKNPYFSPIDQSAYKYAKQCLKAKDIGSQTGFIYHDVSLGLALHCQIKECYKLLEISLNLYCNDQKFDDELALLSGEADKVEFQSKNIKLSDVFSKQQQTHFSKIENSYLYQELNENTVKLVRFILKILPSEKHCQIQENAFVKTSFQENVYSVKFIELVFEQNSDSSLIFPKNVTFFNFTKVTLNNIHISSQQGLIQIGINNFFSVTSLSINNFIIENCQNLYFSIIIENPKLIELKNINIVHSIFNDLGGLIQYKVRDNFDDSQLKVQISNVLIQDSKFFSSVLFLQLIEESQKNQILSLNNFYSKNSEYHNSIVVYTDFKLTERSSQIVINGFQSEFDLLISSSFCTLHGALSTNLINIVVQNGIFNETSRLFVLPLFEISNFIIRNNMFESLQSRTITNVIQSLYSDNITINKVSISDAYFQYNQYEGSQVFLELIISRNFQNLEAEIQNIVINSNILKNNDQSFQTLTNSSLYFKLQKATVTNIKITRAFSFSEFSFNNIDQLLIQHLTANMNSSFAIKLVNYNLLCINNVQEIGMGSLISLFNVSKVEFTQIQITNIIAFNQPIIQIKSLLRSNQRLFEQITFKNSQFSDNTLIKNKQEEQPAIISIISEQDSVINLISLTFENNQLHNYYENQKFLSSSTILIQNTYSNISLINSVFLSNMVTNSISSNLVFITNYASITYTNFSQQNKFNYDNFKNRVAWGFDETQTVYVETLMHLFPIKSKGGNGYIISQQLYFEKILSDNSLALEGGAFYFITQSNGQIMIKNSVFNSTSVGLSNQVISKGGAFYIDASQSNLDFTFSNNIVSQSYSRTQGGVFYFEPSRTSNTINVVSSNFLNIYSLFSSFFYLPVSFSSQNLVLKITFSTLTIQNTFGGYLEYLGQLDEITDKDMKSIYLNNLIYIQQGQISFKYINIYDIFQYGLMNIEYPTQIQIDNLIVRNITLVNQKVIEIIFNKKKSTKLIIKNTQFEIITEFDEEITKPTYQLNFQEEISAKCTSNQAIPNSLKAYFNYSISEKRSKINFYTIISNQQNKTILHIDQVSSQQKISLNSVSFNLISCKNCIKGMFSITNIDNQKQTSSINCENLYFQNSLCGTSCLALSSNDVEVPVWNQNQRVLQSSESNLNKLSFTVSILDSSFKNNTALYGGSLLVQSVDLSIQNCQFINNAALYGGAIYLSQNQGNQFYITSSIIANNSADVGGGIFLKNYTINSKKAWNNLFNQNAAKIYGSNIVEFPASLTIKMRDAILFKQIEVKNATNITEIIQIKEYKIGNTAYQSVMLPSGQKLNEYKLYNEKYQNYSPLNLTFRIIALNSMGDQIKSLENSFCNILSRKIIDGVYAEFSQNFTSYNKIHFNQVSQDYNLDDLVVQFDPDIQGYLQLQFDCNSVKIPIFQDTAPYLLKDYFTNYRLLVNIRTFPCQRGEYKSDNGVCKQCDKNYDQYSLVAGGKCQLKDSLTMEEVSPARIKLRPNYWRPFEQSQNIEYCKNYPDNCVGGWDPGNQLCAYAHIGALCEQCDLYNVRGDGEFSVSSQYKCGSCDNVGDNATKIVLISIWTMISILFSVKGTVETVQQMYLQSRFTRILSLVENRKLGYGSILLKVLTNYLQIVGIITTFQLQLPTAFQSSIKAVGSPVDTMSYSQDCLLVKMSNLEIIYFRMIWALIMPLIYSVCFGIFYILAIVVKFIRYNKSVLTTTLIYLFIYLQPTLLGGFISLLSYRTISDVQWIQGNVSYKYDTSQHQIWMFAFILPSTIVLAVLIPFYMFMNLYFLRSKLNSEESRKSWGYLYNEYQQNAYFWEIIKILQKGFIILFLTFYEDLIIIKASLAFLILFIYMFLTKKFSPYKLAYLNLIDEISTLICAASIVLGMTIYQANISDNQEIIWPFYIFLIVINLIFLAIILWEILLTQLVENQEHLDKVRKIINKKYPKLITKNFFFKKLLTNRTKQMRRVKRRFKYIKHYLLAIVRKYPGIYTQPEMVKSSFPSQQYLLNFNDNEPKLTDQQKVPRNYKITEDISKYLDEDKNKIEQQQQQTIQNEE